MLRTTALPVAGLLAATLLTAAPAAAAGETCQGVPATIVGEKGLETLTGTEGPDVIVSNGAFVISALGGDDLICLTGDDNPGLSAGEGDDVVVSTLGASHFTTVVLGPGSDRFTGSAASDVVYAAGKKRRELDDSERDVIDGGPAHRRYGDYVVSGQPGVPNRDEVRVAGDSTVEHYGLPTAEGRLEGAGSTLTLDTTDASSITIDTAAGVLVRGASSAAISGFDDFLLTDENGPRYVTFRGSERDETLTMELVDNPAYDVHMGGGDDEIALTTDRIHRRITTFDGGAGTDQIGIVMPRKQEVRLDLRRGRLLAGFKGRGVPAAARRFEDAEVVARRIEITGTHRANDIRALGCRATVRALGGADKVSPLTLLFDGLMRCRTETTRFEGGRGADVLAGDDGADTLIGGPGRDIANGRSGRDTCRAEKVRRCEVRR